MPTARDAELLQISRRKPLLELTHVNVDVNGVPVQFARSRHNAELINFEFEF
jgi:DNA-binding GntR family transcriptional regulator